MRDTLETTIHRYFDWYGTLTTDNAQQLLPKVAEWVAMCPTYTWITTNRSLMHAGAEPRNHAQTVTLHLEDERPWLQVSQDRSLWSLHATYSMAELKDMPPDLLFRRRTDIRWTDQCLKIDQYAPIGAFIEWIVAPDFPLDYDSDRCKPTEIIYKSPVNTSLWNLIGEESEGSKLSYL